MSSTPYEIERKFLLLDDPDLAALESAAISSSEIVQTYLVDRARRRRARTSPARARRRRRAPPADAHAQGRGVVRRGRGVRARGLRGRVRRAARPAPTPTRRAVVKTRWVVPARRAPPRDRPHRRAARALAARDRAARHRAARRRRSTCRRGSAATARSPATRRTRTGCSHCPTARQDEPVPGRPLSEIVDPGWAQALAPVADDIARMGDFLRDGGRRRPRLPPGRRPGAARVHATVRRRPRARSSARTRTRRRGTRSGCQLLGRPRRAAACRAAWRTSTASSSPTSASRRRRTGDLSPWADRGVLLLNRVLTVSPGPRRARTAARAGRR